MFRIRAWYLGVQEAGDQIRSARFQVALVATLLLTILATTVGVQDYSRRQDQFAQDTAAVESARRIAKPLMGWTVDTSLRAVRPPALASVWVRGLDAGLPAYWDFAPQGEVEGPLPPSLTRTSEISGWLDLEVVVRVVLSLLAVVLGLEIAAGGRATGTLTALLSLPVRRSTIILGKLGGVTIALAFALMSMSAAACGTVWWIRLDLLTPELLAFLGSFAAAALGYLLVMFTGALCVGSLVRGYAAATGTAAALWVTVVLVTPQVTAIAVRALAPIPEATTVEQERQQRFDARLRSAMEFFGKRYRELATGTVLTFRAEIDLNETSRNDISASWIADAHETRTILNALDERAKQAFEAQSHLMSWSARLSPGTLFVEIATNLADTGRSKEERWATAIRSYQQELADKLFDDLPRLTLKVPAQAALVSASFDRHPPPHAQDLARFRPVATSIGDRIRLCRVDLLVLLAYLTVFVGGALMAFPRTGLSRLR